MISLSLLWRTLSKYFEKFSGELSPEDLRLAIEILPLDTTYCFLIIHKSMIGVESVQ